jgi:PAS domain S-box-containing protein
VAKQQPTKAAAGGGPPKAWRLLHELEVHQAELQAQNDELRRMQVELHESRDRFYQLYQLAPVGYVTISVDGTILDANQAAIALLDGQASEVVGRRLSQFLDPSCADAFHIYRENLFTSDVVRTLFVEVKRRDGRRRAVRLEASGHEWRADGHRQGLVVLTDITEQQQAAERVRVLNAELTRRVAELHLLTKRILTAQDEERGRIARELHDETGQLGGVIAELSALEGTIDDEGVRQRLRGIRERAAEGMREIRRISHGMHPSPLLSSGLGAAMERQAAEFTAAHGVIITTELIGFGNGERRLPPAVEINLYRIVQEAFTNIARHAAATRGRLYAAYERTRVRLEIVDDGRGFITDGRRDGGGPAGFGLSGMRERAAMLGAELFVTSAPGHGTTVTVSVPLEDANDDESDSDRNR